MRRQWDIKRELLVDEILKEAEKNGVHLKYTYPQEDEQSGKTSLSGGLVRGFIRGIIDGTKTGFDGAKENVDEFNRILNSD